MDDGELVRYARSGDVHIAYKTFGSPLGEDLLVTLPATFTIDSTRMIARVMTDVSAHARVTVFDKRGTGASDPVANFTFQERIDDLRAVMDAANIQAGHLFGSSEGGPMSILFAATYPDRVRSLTLYGTYPSWMRKADYPYGFDMTLREYSAWVDRVMNAYAGDLEDLQWFLEMWTPSLASDPDFLATMTKVTSAISPTAAQAIWEAMYEVDIRHLLPALRVPTTIVHFDGDRVCPIEGGRYLAEHIKGAKLIELTGTDHLSPVPVPEIATAILENMERAQGREHTRTNRRLATVLFTDIVNSTPAVARAGDQRWKEILDQHDATSEKLIAAHEGSLIKFTGDGLIATFDGPSRAVRCATALHAKLGDQEIPIRAGLHAGEIEQRRDDIAGMAVHIAARVAGLAQTGQTLVSSTVKDLVIGSGFEFDDQGEHELKGVDRRWRLWQLSHNLTR